MGAQINGELACWPHVTPGFFMRLASTPGPCTFVSEKDLDALYQYMPLLREEAAGDLQTHPIFAGNMWHAYHIQTIYVPELNKPVHICDNQDSEDEDSEDEGSVE